LRTITDEQDLVRAIRERLASREPLLVAVDGLAGSGKSTLSRRLATALPAAHIEVDDFVEAKQGTYVVHLRRDEVVNRVQSELGASRTVLFDAICAVEALRSVDLVPDLHIYVRKVDARGDWFDGEQYTQGLTEEQVIAQEQGLAAIMGGELSALHREVIHYHCAYRPWERADLVYQHGDAPEA
jgi:cytidylate kinase